MSAEHRPGTSGRRRALAWTVVAGTVLATAYVAWQRGVLPATWRAAPHERYAAQLRSSGLTDTALGRDWLTAAELAISQPLGVSLPHHEVLWFPQGEVRAVGYRLALRRGQRFHASALVEGPAAIVFLDLFDAREQRRSHVAAAADGTTEMWVEIEHDGDYVLRVQPELLRSVRVELRQTLTATMAVPVRGAERTAIGGPFGAPRDGGRRAHEGVDIFAPRGTPVIAAAPGVVSAVTTNALGGNVVWVWHPQRRQSHYYAHLETQQAVTGQPVRPGDVLGAVGDSGNARGTPPHLHFGIYRWGSGAVDPLPFINPSAPSPPDIEARTDALGSMARVATARTTMTVPLETARSRTLPTETVLEVVGATARKYRVRLPDGEEGFVDAGHVDVGLAPVRRLVARADAAIVERPDGGATVIGRLAARTPVMLLGRFGEFVLVRPDSGADAWSSRAAFASTTGQGRTSHSPPREPPPER